MRPGDQIEAASHERALLVENRMIRAILPLQAILALQCDDAGRRRRPGEGCQARQRLRCQIDRAVVCLRTQGRHHPHACGQRCRRKCRVHRGKAIISIGAEDGRGIEPQREHRQLLGPDIDRRKRDVNLRPHACQQGRDDARLGAAQNNNSIVRQQPDMYQMRGQCFHLLRQRGKGQALAGIIDKRRRIGPHLGGAFQQGVQRIGGQRIGVRGVSGRHGAFLHH